MDPSERIDLPATQNQSALNPYTQSAIPMGMPAEEESASGSFSFVGLLHSLRRQWLPAALIGFCLASLLAVALWFMIPVTYTAEAFLRVDRDQIRGTSSEFMLYKETQGQLLRSAYVVNTALSNTDINQLGMVKYDNLGYQRKRPTDWLSGAVNVKVDEDELLYVTMKGRIKKETKVILNGVLEAFIDKVVNEERFQKVTQLNGLRKRYQAVYQSIVDQTEEVTKLAESLGAVDNKVIEREQSLKLQELRRAEAETDRITREFMSSQTKYRMLTAELNSPTVQPSEHAVLELVESNPRYLPVIQELEQLRDYLEQNSEYIQAGSRQYEQYQERIAFLERKREKMLRELRPRAIDRLQRDAGWSRDDLRRQIPVQRTLVDSLRQQLATARAISEKKRDEMERFGGSSGELQARQNVLSALQREMEKVKEGITELEIELEQPQRVVIVQPPTVKRASTLIPKLIQICGGWGITLLGTIAGISYLDYLRQRVNTSDDVSLRVVGSLPSVQSHKGSIEETMRIAADGVRTAILYNRMLPAQCVMVTSGTGQEGRSTVASQLAVSMARAGKTTLLIDGDLRNPQQHAIFSVQPRGGLGEMLRGEQTSDQAILATDVENVWLLSTGRCDQQSLRGLSGEQAKTIFEDFRSRFDSIIIDASPVLTSPDALLMGQNADAAVLSVRRDISQTPKVNAAADQLASVGIPVIGCVMNGGKVEVRKSPTIQAVAPSEEKPALTKA